MQLRLGVLVVGSLDWESKDYEPLAILDYKGVRGYLSAFWVE